VTPFPIKPALDLFSEIDWLHFSLFQERVRSFLSIRGLHGSRNQDRPGFDQQIQAIGQQDKRIAPEIIPPSVAFEVRGKIHVVMQEGRAPVVGGNHVLEGAGEGTARFSTHSRTLQQEGHNKSILMSDPISDPISGMDQPAYRIRI